MFWKKKRNDEKKVSTENFAIQDNNLGEVSGGHKIGRSDVDLSGDGPVTVEVTPGGKATKTDNK